CAATDCKRGRGAERRREARRTSHIDRRAGLDARVGVGAVAVLAGRLATGDALRVPPDVLRRRRTARATLAGRNDATRRASRRVARAPAALGRDRAQRSVGARAVGLGSGVATVPIARSLAGSRLPALCAHAVLSIARPQGSGPRLTPLADVR